MNSDGYDAHKKDKHLHPSEISHSEWCPRASYHRLAGHTPHSEGPVTHWQMRMIFDEGKEIHRKWQNRIWDLGRLTGYFRCMDCKGIWWDTSPARCQYCGAARPFLEYKEVPLQDAALRMEGSADGIDGDDRATIEIKSVGVNTLRFEAPQLLMNHTYKLNINGRNREFLDYDGLWDSIRVPFPSHIRQVHLYQYMGAPPEAIFLYECKWNQKVKEMVVKYREERISDRLEWCRQIVAGLQDGGIPDCPFDGCADCQRYERKGRDHPRKILVRRGTAAQASAVEKSPRNR